MTKKEAEILWRFNPETRSIEWVGPDTEEERELLEVDEKLRKELARERGKNSFSRRMEED